MRKRIYEIIEQAKEGDRISFIYDCVMLVAIVVRRCILLPLLFNIVLEIMIKAVIQEKKLKSFKLKRKVKASLFADDIILHIENPKDLTKILE